MTASDSSSRRRFLRGIGGAVVGLPLLEAFRPRGARAATPSTAVFVVNMNGVQQEGFGEPERFWPRALGPLTQTGLAAESDRATSVLAPHAERLIFMRGVKNPFSQGGCAHSGGGNMVLTGHPPSTTPAKNKSLAMGESVDNFIARRMGVQPLALYAGPKGGYINDHISFRGPKDVRVAENNPWLAYTRLIGMGTTTTSPELLMRLATKRNSVNDFVREQMKELLARKDLSATDRQRLDEHFGAIREVETKISTQLSPAEAMRLKSADGMHRSNDLRLEVEKMQMDLIVFALTAGYTRVAFLQIGDGTDGMTYTIDGVKLPRFHLISHRASSDGVVSDGTMPMATLHHAKIDRIVMGQLKYLLDKLAAARTPDGSLLDSGFAVWANHVGTGSHENYNIPYIIAGNAGGYLKTGQFFSTTGALRPSSSQNVTNNKLLNVFANAAGIRKPDGAPVDDLGDPSLPRGLIDGIVRR